MVNVIVAFVSGLVVMDFAWAWKMGMPQRIWRRCVSRSRPGVERMLKQFRSR
jgi:hypothetical protein